MHSRLLSWSRYALLGGMVLALVLVIPIAWFPFQLSKVAAFAVCLAVAAILFVIGGGVRSLLRTHGFLAALAIGSLPLLYALSAALSHGGLVSISGFSIETDTVVFVILGAVAYLLSFTLFRTLRTARMLTTTLFWALVAAVAFQLLSITVGSAVLPFDTFSDRSVNLIGKWNDLGLLAALLGVLLFARVELSVQSNLWRIAAAVGGVVVVALLGLVNFPLAWMMLLGGSVVIGVLALLRQRADRTESGSTFALPYYALAGVVVSILFLIYGTAINASLTSIFPVSSLEVRPGIVSTLDVENKARGGVRETLFGTGPNTFGEAWLSYKPADVNRTPFWNLDFNVGYSTLATALGTVGFLGALAWLVPLILLIAALVRVARLNVLSRDERMVAAYLGLGSLYLLATLAFYVPSQNILLLMFILSGAAFGFLWRQGRQAGEELPPPTTREGVGVLIVAAVLLVLVIGSGLVTSRRFVAQAYSGQGFYALGQGRVDDALSAAARSLQVEKTPDGLRLRADAGMQKLTRIAQDNTLKVEDARTQFAAQVQVAIPAAQDATILSPRDYRPFFSLARLYHLLAELKVDGAYPSAEGAYAAAAQRNPTNPAIPLALARLEAGQGNAKATEEALTKSLQLKPDYTDAILFVVQVNVANNDLASAIRNTQTAVQTAPGVPSVWFQLGLLYYSGGDTKNAIPALEQALTLASDYANAKYFLGLAYSREGRQSDAIKLFENLAASNPGNTEVNTILANLRANKNPLEGLQSAAPEKRPAAPVSQ